MVIPKFSSFATNVLNDRYAHTLIDGRKETWPEICMRVAVNVMGAVNAPKWMTFQLYELMVARKFIPGGRYLYAAGNEWHQTQNCGLNIAEDTREGWADLLYKSTMTLTSGAGLGVVYSRLREEGAPLKRMGGYSSGPIPLMNAVNEVGRSAKSGGSRRAAIWAGLRWNHPDVFKFIVLKNWSPEVEAAKSADFNAWAPMDHTNISVIFDDDFLIAYAAGDSLAHQVYWAVVRQSCMTGDPGFSMNFGVNAGEDGRNACVTGDTEILTKRGYAPIATLVDQRVDVWNGFEWSEVTPKVTGTNQEILGVTLSSGVTLKCTPEHSFWLTRGYHGEKEKVLAKDLKIGDKLIKHEFPVINEGFQIEPDKAYTQGFVSGDGMDHYKFFTVYAPKFPCIPRLMAKVGKPLEDVDRVTAWLYTDVQPKTFVPHTWSAQGRLNWLAGLLDSDGTELVEGGVQLGSIDNTFLLSVQKMLTTLGVASKINKANPPGWRDLPDGKGGTAKYYCQQSYRLCIGAMAIQYLRQLGLVCNRLKLDKFPNRDASRFITVDKIEALGVADTVYCFNEPKRHLGCFDGVVTGQCTEITTRDDGDICNLGSINLANIESEVEMRMVVELGTAFLLAGTVYSDVPYEKVRQVREKNRRLGLGLMGVHEWLLKHNRRYGDKIELLDIYATSGEYAAKWAKEWNLSCPIKTRAIAPVGTIGIIGETSTGIEPLFCVAYQRRRYNHGTWVKEFVVDPTARRLIAEGVNPDSIEDAYSLSHSVGRRIAFQSYVQRYVDHAIASTINMPAWGSPTNNEDTLTSFGNTLMKYLPTLRGITTYPDGARSGQPLEPVDLAYALKHEGEVTEEAGDVCSLKGGSCGA